MGQISENSDTFVGKQRAFVGILQRTVGKHSHIGFCLPTARREIGVSAENRRFRKKSEFPGLSEFLQDIQKVQLKVLLYEKSAIISAIIIGGFHEPRSFCRKSEFPQKENSRK